MQTSIYLPEWLRDRLPEHQPRGWLSTFVQAALIEAFPKPSAPDSEKLEELIVRTRLEVLMKAVR